MNSSLTRSKTQDTNITGATCQSVNDNTMTTLCPFYVFSWIRRIIQVISHHSETYVAMCRLLCDHSIMICGGRMVADLLELHIIDRQLRTRSRHMLSALQTLVSTNVVLRFVFEHHDVLVGPIIRPMQLELLANSKQLLQPIAACNENRWSRNFGIGHLWPSSCFYIWILVHVGMNTAAK
jgi:hypothetical protein